MPRPPMSAGAANVILGAVLVVGLLIWQGVSALLVWLGWW